MKKWVPIIILVVFASALSAAFTFLFMNKQLVEERQLCSAKKLELESEAIDLKQDIKTLEDKSGTTATDFPESQESILYFYSPSCGYCKQQSPIVTELEGEGLKFTYMNVQENPNYFTKYNISGTPTFIYKNKKLAGLQTKEVLKNFWDSTN